MAEQQVEQPQESSNLTIADLQTISNIIDIAMTRGAFRANEAKAVGGLYEKINAFLQTVQQQAQQTETPQAVAGNIAADANAPEAAKSTVKGGT
ncbi:MAG TPA: hypothetical protein DCS22_05460 [Flavobacteriaceae bacterium]|nr:hypothetical protein [Flavobacteriaceae bacterium]|tara:strand:- start:930 stop:1211 length:282 start_codon:yes stop_codon:yes gene_type:complete